MLYQDPCVYLVEEEYQIVFNVEEKGVAWVEIGGESWRDSQGGPMRSETLVHRVTVPRAALDAVTAMGLHPREILREVEKTHIFTHIQWNMKGIYLEVAETGGSFLWFTEEEINLQAALPTAFRQFWEK